MMLLERRRSAGVDAGGIDHVGVGAAFSFAFVIALFGGGLEEVLQPRTDLGYGPFGQC